jgi:hypothetical protein
MNRINREREIRASALSNTYEMEFTNPLSLPPGVAKDGFVYHWGRMSVKGKDDYRLEELLKEGWSVVPAERAESYVNLDPLNRNPLGKQFICQKDVILLEKEAKLVNERTRLFNEGNANKIKSLRGVSNDIGSFARPLNSINSF